MVPSLVLIIVQETSTVNPKPHTLNLNPIPHTPEATSFGYTGKCCLVTDPRRADRPGVEKSQGPAAKALNPKPKPYQDPPRAL